MIELNEEEFRLFLDKHSQKTFLQTPEIANLRNKNGWDVYYLGLKENNQLVAATMIVSIKKFMNKKTFYAPRGILIDYNNYQLLETFTKEIKKFIRNKNGFILRIDPYVINKQRDIDGKIIKNGFDNTQIVNSLEKLGFNSIYKGEQVKWMFILDIDNKTSDEILKNMCSNTRNRIKYSIKTGVTVRELTYNELPLFKEITDLTSERKKYFNRNMNYYQDMYNAFHGKNQIKYLVSEIDLNNYINILESDKKDEIVKKEKLVNNKDNVGKIKEIDVTISSLNKKINEAKEIIKTGVNKLSLSSAMFIMYGDEIIYLSSGNRREYINFGGQYRIQWEMINYGINNHFKRYNFYGIMDSFDPKDKDYGIYQFKRGFNGYVEELIGEFDYPVTNLYYLYNLE
jgi:lipid II:glycine glycyltransferase (peptidoglycan interpeptide bridge formation enzyme)